jgi:cupin 2 domain-containing protein
MPSGNIFANVPERLDDEQLLTLFTSPNTRIERIVSTGQASKPGEWHNQDWTEWVMLLTGSAGLQIEGEATPRTLLPGDYVELPAQTRHRVEWTDVDSPTIWLAVHIGK